MCPLVTTVLGVIFTSRSFSTLNFCMLAQKFYIYLCVSLRFSSFFRRKMINAMQEDRKRHKEEPTESLNRITSILEKLNGSVV